MPILSEDVIIRLLVDTNKGVADLKKAEGQTKNFAKTALKMAAAMGGAALAFEVVVKAITSYITHIKEAEAAAVKFAKESGGALSDAVVAYDRLNAAKEESKRIDGELHLAYMEGHRERRAARIEETNLVKAMTDAQYASWSAANLGMTRWNEDFESRVDFMLRIQAEQNAYLEQLRQTRAAADESAEANRLLNEAELKAAADRKAKLEEEARLRDEALNAQMMAERDAMQARQDALTAEQELEATVIGNINDLRNKAHADDMARIAEAQELRKQAAIDGLNSASAMFSAINSLVSNSLQNQIDAAEDGSEKQKELMEKQFRAEKAMAIVQSLIATAVGITQAIPNVPLMVFAAVQGAIQTAAIAATSQPSFATSTPPGGYVVPPGYEDDSFPVSAASGETVSVTRPGQDSGQMVYNVINIDGYQFGEIITRLTKSGKATVASRAVVA